MPTTSQSPGPKTTTSPAKLAPRSRKASAPEVKTTGRAGSAGGILLSQSQSREGKIMATANTTAASKVATPPASKDATGTASTGPNRQRRRPRKLNKEPTAPSSAPVPTTATSAKPTPTPKPIPADPTAPPASTSELEALKSRVRGLEAKVEELYKSSTGDARGVRSPRRRGKARKGSSATQVPTLSRTASGVETVVGAVEEEDEEADEELVRLEGELEIARQDLESYRPRRPRTRRSPSSREYEDDDVEEIPREFDASAAPQDKVNMGDRQVTLTGNYRIPLPASVSMTDVKNIQSGVSAAQNVAKSFLEQRRAQAKLSPQPPKTSTPAPKPKGKAATSTAVSTERAEEGGGKSWAEWVGGYSMAITRAVKSIEAEAALETQKKRPGPVQRSSSAATTKGAAKKGTGQRLPLKPRAGNLSSEQVQGLMN